MKLQVIKANANNNQFIVLFKKQLPNDFKINDLVIKKICKKSKSNIVDGLIILDDDLLIVDYYNNDGSWETLCINSLKCIGLILNKLYSKKEFNVLCGDGAHLIHLVSNNNIRINMPTPVYKTKEIIIEKLKGYYINSGAKHFVINFLDEWPKDSILEKIAIKIRYNLKNFPNGVNVNFYKILDKNSIYVKTYEKGIEKMMPSCGSGSFACAYHHAKINNINNILVYNDTGQHLIDLDFSSNIHSISGVALIEYEKEIIF